MDRLGRLGRPYYRAGRDSNAVWFYLKLISATSGLALRLATGYTRGGVRNKNNGGTKKKGKPGQIYQITDC